LLTIFTQDRSWTLSNLTLTTYKTSHIYIDLKKQRVKEFLILFNFRNQIIEKYPILLSFYKTQQTKTYLLKKSKSNKLIKTKNFFLFKGNLRNFNL